MRLGLLPKSRNPTGNRHCNKHLQRAYNKHGKSKFLFFVLERCKSETCVEREQYWIDKLKAANPDCGYNLCPTAGSSLGIKRTEETKQKLSRLMQGKSPHPNMLTAAARANEIQGRKFSEEHKRRIAQSRVMVPRTRKLGRFTLQKPPVSESTKIKLREAQQNRSETHKANLRKPRSEEGKANLKAAQNRSEVKAKIAATRNLPEIIEKTRLAHLGKTHTEEAKLKMSIARKGRKLSDEVKKRMSEAAKLRWSKVN